MRCPHITVGTVFLKTLFYSAFSKVLLFILFISLLPRPAQLCSVIYVSAVNRMLWHVNILNLMYSEGWKNCSRWLLLDKQQVIFSLEKAQTVYFPAICPSFLTVSWVCCGETHAKGSLVSDNPLWSLGKLTHKWRKVCCGPEPLVPNPTSTLPSSLATEKIAWSHLCVPMHPMQGGEPKYNAVAGKESVMSHHWVPWTPGTWWNWSALTLGLGPFKPIKNNWKISKVHADDLWAPVCWLCGWEDKICTWYKWA